MAISSINPATREVLASFEELDNGDLEQRLQRAAAAFPRYRTTSFAERAEMMRRAAATLEQDKERWGRLMASEMGKTLKEAIAEAEKCAWVCHYFADHAADFLADEVFETGAARSYVHYLPLGPILAVMPWNFPFWQVFRFAVPALMAGNVALLKHASNVPQCALAIEEVFRRAGFPEGVFQSLLIGSSRVAGILQDGRIAAATLTGSVGAGSKVASEAGKQVKKTVLELGGSDPFIVMPSADLDTAVTTAVQARNQNNGQSCIAAKRFVVHRDIYDSFEQRFVQALGRLKIGDPMDGETDIGPLAMRETLEAVERQVAESVDRGARLLTGGRRRDGPGNYYLPTALTDIPEDAPAYREEVFGPVASLFKVQDAAEAIRLSNDSIFGLGSSVWTQDDDEQRRFIDELEAGQTFVNAMVASDPRLPFGGVKRSGYGRELSRFGIREFVNIKTVSIGKPILPRQETATPAPE